MRLGETISGYIVRAQHLLYKSSQCKSHTLHHSPRSHMVARAWINFMMPPTKGIPSNVGGALVLSWLLITRSAATASKNTTLPTKYNAAGGSAATPSVRAEKSIPANNRALASALLAQMPSGQ